MDALLYRYFNKLSVVVFFFLVSFSGNAENLLWIDDLESDYENVHAGFRGSFHLEKRTNLTIQISGASAYSLFVDGKFITDGPDRFSPDYPLYQEREITLNEGDHVIAVHVHCTGVETRILEDIPPFLYCRLFSGEDVLEPKWKAKVQKGYLRDFKRVSPQLSWLEWNDTRDNPHGWKQVSFDDSQWGTPVRVSRELGQFKRSNISPVKNESIEFTQVGEGPVANFFGYEKDDPSARFFLRDLECDDIPPQGIWKRYDLGRVRLTRPRFVMDLPERAIVEFAFSEYLRHERVMPWINLSLDDSFNMVINLGGGNGMFFPVT